MGYEVSGIRYQVSGIGFWCSCDPDSETPVVTVMTTTGLNKLLKLMQANHRTIRCVTGPARKVEM